MDKLFLVELSGGNIRHCELELPATDYELLDALDKLRISAVDKLRFDICDYYGYHYLAPFISHALNLNAQHALTPNLAEKHAKRRAAYSWSETPTVAVAMLSVTQTWWRRTRIWI